MLPGINVGETQYNASISNGIVAMQTLYTTLQLHFQIQLAKSERST